MLDGAIERRNNVPQVFFDERNVAQLVFVDVTNERVGLEVNGISGRNLRGVQTPAQRLEEQAQVIVRQAIADKKRRPLDEMRENILADRMIRMLVAHAQDKLYIVFIRHHD